MHVNTDVKRLTDTEVLDDFLAALPQGESQEVSARRAGKSQSWLSRVQAARAGEEEVGLKAADRRRIVAATAELREEDEVSRARREAFRQAANDAQALADRYKALATPSARGALAAARKASAVGKKPTPKTKPNQDE